MSPIFGVGGGGQDRGLDPMQQGTLRLWHGGGTANAFQPLVHLAHPIGGGCRQRIQECDRCSHILASPGEGRKLVLHLLLRHGLACL
jgi:hypothetical protein